MDTNIKYIVLCLVISILVILEHIFNNLTLYKARYYHFGCEFISMLNIFRI